MDGLKHVKGRMHSERSFIIPSIAGISAIVVNNYMKDGRFNSLGNVLVASLSKVWPSINCQADRNAPPSYSPTGQWRRSLNNKINFKYS